MLQTRNLHRQSEIFNSPEFCAEVSVQNSGDSSVVVPPVPIPNTEVKRCSSDGSTATGRARVGRRQNKNPGEFIIGVFAFGGRLLEHRQRPERTGPWEPRDGRSNPRGQRRVSGSERVNRPSPDPTTLLTK